MDRIKNKGELPHSDISEKIIGCCFEVMKELGSGFLENVYKNALFLAIKQKGLNILAEQPEFANSLLIFEQDQNIDWFYSLITIRCQLVERTRE